MRGNGCYLSFSFSGGRDGAWPDRTVTTLSDTTMTFGPGGEFEIVVGPDVAGGPDAVRTEPDMSSLIVNDATAVPDDGARADAVTIVIGAVRPAEPNWLNTFGWDKGTMIFRYMFAEAKPARPEITVRKRTGTPTTAKAGSE